MTLNNVDKNLVERQLKKAERPQLRIRTGGIVVGRKGHGYSELRAARQGEVLMGADTSTGLAFSSDVPSSSAQFKRNDSEDPYFSEKILLDGVADLTHVYVGSSTAGNWRYAYIDIEHKMKNLEDNVLSASYMYNFQNIWQVGTAYTPYFSGGPGAGSLPVNYLSPIRMHIPRCHGYTTCAYRIWITVKKGFAGMKATEKEEV